MMPESAMVLTGKTALDYSGSVSAEDNLGIGGYERIMGPNGQAQYWAPDLHNALDILLRHYAHTYVMAGERFPRRAETRDPATRDICTFLHGRVGAADFPLVGHALLSEGNPGRKRAFDVRRIMLAVADQDHPPLERWPGMLDAENSVVWDAHVGGYPVCLLGFESRPLSRLGFVPTDGPDHWTAGTLFPMASKKTARAINAASANRPLVVLANLSGFDGSPESMRRRQLEFGAEIGRAVVNFIGPIVFVVISRYHGGAFVVFSKTLHDNMEVAALEGTYASVIGGAPAAAVVFARDVEMRTRQDARVVEAGHELAGADENSRRRLRSRVAAVARMVRSEKLGEVADEFDRIHSVSRARKVGSLDRIIPAHELRPFVIEAVERGMARELERWRGARSAGVLAHS
jgi:acetyl-CoA carboxylase carboxyltransferase component